MKPRHIKRHNLYFSKLRKYEVRALPGIESDQALSVLVMQLIDSLRRIEYARHISLTTHSQIFENPATSQFDPLRAAVLGSRIGDQDQAYWMVFIATHFGKHPIDGWRLARDVYGGVDQKNPWTWQRITEQFPLFVEQYDEHYKAMKSDAISRRFSSHRKYSSLRHVPKVFESYIKWINSFGGHEHIISSVHKFVGQNPHVTFDYLYDSMSGVHGFGRLGKFDFLTMLGKLGIAPIEPGSAYLKGATGPLPGAKLLFYGSRNQDVDAETLENYLSEIDDYLLVGKQVLEDSLCNWQKSPLVYNLFRG